MLQAALFNCEPFTSFPPLTSLSLPLSQEGAHILYFRGIWTPPLPKKEKEKEKKPTSNQFIFALTLVPQHSLPEHFLHNVEKVSFLTYFGYKVVHRRVEAQALVSFCMSLELVKI